MLGTAPSNAAAGYVVQWFGYLANFRYLAGMALVFSAVLMPATGSMDHS